MAKKTCKHCGKEVGFVSEIQLGDGNVICKDCNEKAGRVFNYQVHSYPAFERLLREQARNEQIYEKILKKQKRSECFGADSKWYLFCYADSGLMYFEMKRGGFLGLGGDKLYSMYRYADLAKYEEVDGRRSMDHRMEDGKSYIHLVFAGDYAVKDVYMPSKPGMHRQLSKYFDECFGKGGKGIKGFKQSIQRGKEQVAAAAAITDSVKSAMNGGDRAQAAEIANASMQIALMGDRTQWVQKTEQALAGAGISWNV